MANRSLGWAIAAVFWVVFPLVGAIAWQVISDRLILQDSSRRWIAMGVVAVAYILVGLWLFGGRVPGGGFARSIGFFVAWAMLAGYYTGPLALTLINAAGDRSGGRVVQLQDAGARLRALVRLRATDPDPDLDGVTFTCSQRAWRSVRNPEPHGGAPAVIRRGRLGLQWAELSPPGST